MTEPKSGTECWCCCLPLAYYSRGGGACGAPLAWRGTGTLKRLHSSAAGYQRAWERVGSLKGLLGRVVAGAGAGAGALARSEAGTGWMRPWAGRSLFSTAHATTAA